MSGPLGWLCAAAVVDLFSRRVVAAMTAQLVTDALVMAIWRWGKPDARLHHSDRGDQYASEQFQRLMADDGVVCSMSRSGNVWDNATMESFFSSLKTERTARQKRRLFENIFSSDNHFINPFKIGFGNMKIRSHRHILARTRCNTDKAAHLAQKWLIIYGVTDISRLWRLDSSDGRGQVACKRGRSTSTL